MTSNIDRDNTTADNKNIGHTTREAPKAISLKVAEAEQRDVGRKMSHVDPSGS